MGKLVVGSEEVVKVDADKEKVRWKGERGWLR